MTAHSLPEHIDLEKLREIFTALAKRRIRNGDDAEEIVQDALLTIVEKHADQAFEKGFMQWAYGVLRNKIGNYYQKRDRRAQHSRGVEDVDLRVRPDDSPSPLEQLRESELRSRIQTAWSRLGEHCRKLLWMLYRGYPREEIFRAFPEYDFKVVNTKIFRCRNYLKRLLRKEGYHL